MRRATLLALFFVTAVLGQPALPPISPLGQLQEFLRLTNVQAEAILKNNDEYNQWSNERQMRIYQVQTEIGEETRRETLDPGALGIRYAEIESTCRQIRDRAVEVRTRNLAVLTPDQKNRLTMLDEAIKLMPIVSLAQYANIMNPGSVTPGSLLGSQTRPIDPLPGNVIPVARISPFGGCPSGFAAFLLGGVTTQPAQPQAK